MVFPVVPVTAASSLATAAATGARPFRTGVLPVLTKAGCNGGACHGAASGQGGFRLSLLGYDPEEDYARITRELGGRRVDLQRPDESLLLRKPSGRMEHEGGRRLPRGAGGYELVRQWIAAGAPYGPRDLRVTGLEVKPDDLLIDGTNEKRLLQVTALLSDGSRRDVTRLALYTSNDDAVVEVAPTGEVKTVGRGLTSVMVRFSGQVAAARIAVPLGGPGVGPGDFPEVNFIDRHIRAELARLRVPVSPLSDDAEFLRRVQLDVTGRLPSPETTRQFLGAPPAGKRERLIDALIGSDDLVDFWTMQLADLLLVNGQGAAAKAYYGWLREQLRTNAPFDAMARTLLTSTGALARVGPANFVTLAQDPRDLSEHVSRIFLGTRIACARCHAHPSDRWTQDDYHGFAACFARFSREDGVIRASTRGEVEHPKTGKAVRPRALGSIELLPDEGDRRQELAAWLVAPENPLFARAIVNRVWRHLLGRGLVEPVDDLRPSNPPTHPALLEALAADFVAHRFDLRQLIRTIVTSRTYQLSSRALGVNARDTRLYSRAYLRELAAPVFADAVAQVTGVPDVYDGYPPGTRAVQLMSPAVPAPALDILGRCARTRPCDGSARTGGGVAQALHLLNGSTINDKLAGGVVERMNGRPDREVIEELYLRALARRPEPAEMKEWENLLRTAPSRAAAVQDLLWTVLNSREFAFNH